MFDHRCDHCDSPVLSLFVPPTDQVVRLPCTVGFQSSTVGLPFVDTTAEKHLDLDL